MGSPGHLAEENLVPSRCGLPFFTCKLCVPAGCALRPPAFLLWGGLVSEVLLLYTKRWLAPDTVTCSRDLCLVQAMLNRDNLLKSPSGCKATELGASWHNLPV